MNVDLLALLGYDPSTILTRVRVATASGVESVPRLAIERITALDQVRHRFPVVCHTLPPSTGVDGLLGLDFSEDNG